jgi:hypothetical protein
MTLSGLLRDIVAEEQSMKAILDRGGDYALCSGVNALMKWVDEIISTNIRRVSLEVINAC